MRFCVKISIYEHLYFFLGIFENFTNKLKMDMYRYMYIYIYIYIYIFVSFFFRRAIPGRHH